MVECTHTHTHTRTNKAEYLKAVERGMGLVREARDIITALSAHTHTHTNEEKIHVCIDQLCEWLSSACVCVSSARFLTLTHPLRSDAAMLLLRLCQLHPHTHKDIYTQDIHHLAERPHTHTHTATHTLVATAAAAGVMDVCVCVKGLREQPQRASLLVVKAKALFSIAKMMREKEERRGKEGENGEGEGEGEVISGLGWQVYEYHAQTAARSASVIYERAYGGDHPLTQSVGMLLKEEKEAN